jgi:DNA repair exonuclease SbcCD ATPase subunit
MVNPNTEDKKTRAAEAKKTRDGLNKTIDAIKPLNETVEIAEHVVSVYSPKGVRAHILDTVTPYLNERTAHYLGALTDGEIQAVWQTISLTAKGEARENFKISVTGDDGKGTFVDLSGGEKRKVRIACALALQDLVSTRASKSLDLFIADEIDDALDTSGLERLMGILDEKARERGSVFIISHSDLRDWVSNVMTVKKDTTSSTVVSA